MSNVDRNKPYDYLNAWLDKHVKVKLKEGNIIEGVFVSYDIHMNIVIRQTKELETSHIFIRGDSLLYIERYEK